MAYASEKVLLEVELYVGILLDNLEDLECLVDDLDDVRELFCRAFLQKLCTSGPTPSPAPIGSVAAREAQRC